MNITRIIIFTFFFISTVPFFSQEQGKVFQYKDVPGLRYRISSQVDQQVFENWSELYVSDIVNNVSVDVLSVDAQKRAQIKSVYQISERKNNGPYIQIEENATGEYDRNARGEVSGIAEDVLYPQLRNMLVFPEKALKFGDKWTHPATEKQDLGSWSSVPYFVEVPFEVTYEYIGQKTYEDKNTDIIALSYGYRYELTEAEKKEYQIPNLVAFESQAVGRFLWDDELGQPVYVDDKFHFTFFLEGNQRYDFTGHAEGYLIVAQDLKNEDKKIRTALKNEDIKVEKVDEGIKINIDNLLFKTNTSELLPGQEEKLAVISHLLEQYPDRNILVRGHTFSVGQPASEQKLSEARASTIASEFLKSPLIKSTNIIVEGAGSTEMIDPKNPEVNRRVEVTILEN